VNLVIQIKGYIYDIFSVTPIFVTEFTSNGEFGHTNWRNPSSCGAEGAVPI